MLREIFGGLGVCPQKFSMIAYSRTSKNALLRTHLEIRNLIVSESNQTNAKMMEKIPVSTTSRETLVSEGLLLEKCSKIALSIMSENALLRSRKTCFLLTHE